MKKILLMCFCMIAAIGLMACGNNASAMNDESPAETESLQQTSSEKAGTTPDNPVLDEADAPEVPQAGKNTLVVYFSATGTTKSVAEKIAAVADADTYEILAAQPYSEKDLNYNDTDSRTTQEQNNPDIRPEIGSDDISLEGYKTIYIGYPIWHGQAPRIMSTFVEKYNFEGITVIPFCTSGSSGIGQSAATLEKQAAGGKWLEGKRFGGNVSEDDLRSWIDEM
jgi:flavodoxin